MRCTALVVLSSPDNIKLSLWTSAAVDFGHKMHVHFVCVCLREKEGETVPQLANEGVVCVCLCVCFARTWLALCLQFEWYHWTPRLFTLHSALCSQVCMRQSLCDQPVVHFTKDGRNVVVEEWNFVLVECVCVSAFVWAVYSMTCWNYVTC